MSEQDKRKKSRTIHLPLPKQTDYTFESLYKEYYGEIVKALSNLVDTPHDAEDIAQETMLRVLTRWGDWRMENPPALLSEIAIGYYRKYILAVNREVDYRSVESNPFMLVDDSADGPFTDFIDPMILLHKDQVFEKNLGKIGFLNKRDQVLIEMIFQDGLTMKQASIELDTNYANIRKRLERARNRIGRYNGTL